MKSETAQRTECKTPTPTESRARCCGTSSSGNVCLTNVTVSAPAGNVVWSSLTGLQIVGRHLQDGFLNHRTSCNSPKG